MGIPFFYYISCFGWPLQLLTFLALLFLSFWACDEAGKIYNEADDGRIVIDELVGYLVTVAFLPFTWTTAILGFFCFRFFDILKPLGVRRLEKLNGGGGLGVMADDGGAGLLSALATQLTVRLLGWM